MHLSAEHFLKCRNMFTVMITFWFRALLTQSKTMDPKMQQFIQAETERQRFQVHTIYIMNGVLFKPSYIVYWLDLLVKHEWCAMCSVHPFLVRFPSLLQPKLRLLVCGLGNLTMCIQKPPTVYIVSYEKCILILYSGQRIVLGWYTMHS